MADPCRLSSQFSYSLSLFFFFLFLSTYYTRSIKWRTTTTTTIINNIINPTAHGRAITIIINWLSKKFICLINMLSDSFSSTWSLLWLIADRKKNEHEFDMKLLFFLRLQIITKGMCTSYLHLYIVINWNLVRFIK